MVTEWIANLSEDWAARGIFIFIFALLGLNALIKEIRGEGAGGGGEQYTTKNQQIAYVREFGSSVIVYNEQGHSLWTKSFCSGFRLIGYTSSTVFHSRKH